MRSGGGQQDKASQVGAVWITELHGFQLDGEGWGVGNVWEESFCLWLEEQTGKSGHP